VKELEDSLFEFRIDLERDELFVLVHSYKGIAKEFSRTVSDLLFVSSAGNSEGNPEDFRDQMRDIYRELDPKHKTVIDHLSAGTL
jgi:hypothetical protein